MTERPYKIILATAALAKVIRRNSNTNPMLSLSIHTCSTVSAYHVQSLVGNNFVKNLLKQKLEIIFYFKKKVCEAIFLAIGVLSFSMWPIFETTMFQYTVQQIATKNTNKSYYFKLNEFFKPRRQIIFI